MRLRLPFFFLSLLAFAAACSGSDTVLVFNFAAASDVIGVAHIDVTATRSNGSPYSATFDTQTPDGGSKLPFFERVTLTDWEGDIHVEAHGVAANMAARGSANRDVSVDKGNAVVVLLTLANPDAGSDAAGDGGGDAARVESGTADGGSADGGSPDDGNPASEDASASDAGAD